ncbi:hypothetical protein Syun_000836 [Stephania yunnanensis]|uniref:alpha-1,2-Mannosidase n=1 Tax=Stephania yunnanensis TaxID=152371 RepID=A0AAP0LCU4_9MAGN
MDCLVVMTCFLKQLAELKLKAEENYVDVKRRQKLIEAMFHAWTSYESHVWGQDELRVGLPQSKDGVNSFGGFGATLIDSLDTLFIMGLEEQFQKAKE